MNPIFDDIRKWKVSMGVGMIVSAGIVWWAFLGLNEALFIDMPSIKMLTKTAQEGVYLRQWMIQSFLPPFLLIYSIVAVIWGGTLILRELPEWQKELSRREKMEEVNYKLAEKKLGPATVEEIGENMSAEILELNEDLVESGNEKKIGMVRNDHISVHKAVTTMIRDKLPKKWALYQDVRVGSVIIDAVLRSISSDTDYLVEIKYIRKGYRTNYMRSLTQKLLQTKILYTMEAKRYSSVLILVVYEESVGENAIREMESANTAALEKVRQETSYYNIQMICRANLDNDAIVRVLDEIAIR